MIYIPIYNAISLPDVSCYFQKEYLNQMSESEIQAGDKVLFMQLKEEKEKGTITGEDIYPIAVWGEIESIDGDWALVHTTGRVNVLSVEKEGEQFQAELSVRPDIEDANEEDLKERFRKMRSALVRVLQGSSLMPSLRNYVMRWKNMNEMIAFTSSVLQASNEEKYAILEEDSVEKRAQMMEEMFYRSLELYKVKNEAQNAQ